MGRHGSLAGVLLFGTVFYPSRMLKDILSVAGMTKRPESRDDLEEIADWYFCWGNSKSGRQHKPMRGRKHLPNDGIEDAEFVEIEQDQEQDGIQS